MILLLDKNEELTRSIDCYDITRTRELNGENTLEIESNEEILEGDRIVFKDEQGVWNEYIVNNVEITHNEEGLTYEAFCENFSYELFHCYVDDIKPRKEGLTSFLSRLLENTRFKIGKIDNVGTVSGNFYHTNIREVLYKIVEKLSCDIDFTIEVEDNNIINRQVNIYKNIGVDNGFRLSYKKDLTYLRKSIDYSNICSKLYGYGKGEEIEKNEGESSYGRRIDFAEINNGLKYVTDEETRLKYGIGKSREHIEAIYVLDECEDKNQLLELTKEELKRRSKPEISYELRIEDNTQYINEGVDCNFESLGDKVLVIDNEMKVRINLRVLKIIDYPYMKKDRLITLGEKPKDISIEFIKLKNVETDLYKLTSLPNSLIGEDFEVINDLVSGGVKTPLSAEQGKILNEKYNDLYESSLNQYDTLNDKYDKFHETSLSQNDILNDKYDSLYKSSLEEHKRLHDKCDELFQFANNGKNKIASAIVGKGVQANPNDTFGDLAEKISQIENLKKMGYFKGDVLTDDEVKVNGSESDINLKIIKKIKQENGGFETIYNKDSIYCIRRMNIKKYDVELNLMWSVNVAEKGNVEDYVINKDTGAITFLLQDGSDLYLGLVDENGKLLKKIHVFNNDVSYYPYIKLVEEGSNGNMLLQIWPYGKHSTIYRCDSNLNLNIMEEFTNGYESDELKLVGSFHDKIFFTGDSEEKLYTYDFKGNRINESDFGQLQAGNHMIQDNQGVVFLSMKEGYVIVYPNGDIGKINLYSPYEGALDGDPPITIQYVRNGVLYLVNNPTLGWDSSRVIKMDYYGKELGEYAFPIYYQDNLVVIDSACFDYMGKYMWALVTTITVDDDGNNEFYHDLVKFEIESIEDGKNTYTIIKDKENEV